LLADAVDRGYLAAMPVRRRPEPIRGLHDEPRIRWLGENDTAEELAKGTGDARRSTRGHAQQLFAGTGSDPRADGDSVHSVPRPVKAKLGGLLLSGIPYLVRAPSRVARDEGTERARWTPTQRAVRLAPVTEEMSTAQFRMHFEGRNEPRSLDATRAGWKSVAVAAT